VTLPWTEILVWIEEPGKRSVYHLHGRRALVALALWKDGRPPAHVRFLDLGSARVLSDPGEVDWSGFSSSETQPDK